MSRRRFFPAPLAPAGIQVPSLTSIIATLGLVLTVTVLGCESGQFPGPGSGDFQRVEIIRVEPDLGWLEVGPASGEVMRLEFARGRLRRQVADQLLPVFPIELLPGQQGDLWIDTVSSREGRWGLHVARWPAQPIGRSVPLGSERGRQPLP